MTGKERLGFVLVLPLPDMKHLCSEMSAELENAAVLRGACRDPARGAKLREEAGGLQPPPGPALQSLGPRLGGSMEGHS